MFNDVNDNKNDNFREAYYYCFDADEIEDCKQSFMNNLLELDDWEINFKQEDATDKLKGNFLLHITAKRINTKRSVGRK